MKTNESVLESSTFEIFSKKVFSELLADESITITLAAEETLFARLSNAKVRQITNLVQAFVEFNFIKGNKTLSFNLPFVGNENDFLQAFQKIKESRSWIEHLPEDPYLVRPEFYGVTKEENLFELPLNEEMVSQILESAHHLDLAGVFSSGDIVRATINSVGQFH